MELQLTAAAGLSDRDMCPVRVPIPELKDGSGARLVEADSGREVPCQVAEGELAFLVNGLGRGQARSYTLTLGGAPTAPAAGFGVKEVADGLEFTVGGQFFTRYNVSPSQTRPYFHPTIGPGGVRVTRSFPMEPGYEGADESVDHPHHTGIYVAHGEVNDVNHWGLRDAGKQLHKEFGAIARGPVYAGAHEHLEWVAPDGTPTLSERRAFAVYNLPGEERLLDVTTTLIAQYGPVHFGDTKEAGLISVRVPSSMEGKRGRGLIENAMGGRGEKATWGKQAPWCHYTGPVGDTVQGIGIFDHPANPRYPTNWHVRDYGLFSANCFGYHDYYPGTQRDGSLRLEQGEQVTFRYRLHFHRGDAAAGKTDQRWADFALPPAVAIDG
jgi:hypothetical protein